jgi:hypothetical protein
MTECASAEALRNLLHTPRLTSLSLKLNTEHWLAVANEIQHDRNKIRVLGLAMFEGTSSEATAAVKAIASAIRQDPIWKGFCWKWITGSRIKRV